MDVPWHSGCPDAWEVIAANTEPVVSQPLWQDNSYMAKKLR